MVSNKYFPGSSVSRYLSPTGRSWDEAVYQSGKPVLDAELNLSQEISQTQRQIVQQRVSPSGWLRGPLPNTPASDFVFLGALDRNAFRMVARSAIVAGMPITVEYTVTDTTGFNSILLQPANLPTSSPGVKRTDFVFLEVFRALVSWSPRASATLEVTGVVAAGDTFSIVSGGLFDLTAIDAGPPGVDQFVIGINAASTATNIAAALNLVTNSFAAVFGASVDATNSALINLVASDFLAGAIGNAIAIFLASEGLVVSGPNFTGGSDEPNKPTQYGIYHHGNVLSNADMAFMDDIADPAIGTESTKRVQIQYRIRSTGSSEAVNFKSEPDGFSNPAVLAQGVQIAPVTSYPFVPADGESTGGDSSAIAYGLVDSGLWVAGDGSQASATALGTVDGFVYAIPLAFVFRRNDGYDSGSGVGFDPDNNANSALSSIHEDIVNPIIGIIPAGISDRPDGYFHDAIVATDILDLRRQIVPGGLDLKAELDRQVSSLLDGSTRTWAIDTSDKQILASASGDVSTQFLVCDEIGRTVAQGGVVSTRGELVAEFDHIRRRFADWPVVEKVVFSIQPDDLQADQPGKYVVKAGAGSTWFTGDVITIDFDLLKASTDGTWSDITATTMRSVASCWPSGTKVTDIGSVTHDDGHFSIPVSQEVMVDTIVGMGTNLIQITLGENNLRATGGLNVASWPLVDTHPTTGSSRAILVELIITYPAGSGLSNDVSLELEPDPSVYATGALLEYDVTQRPSDFVAISSPVFRTPRREVSLTYTAQRPNADWLLPIMVNIISENRTTLVLPRRISNFALPVVTDNGDGLPRTVSVPDYDSSGRILEIDPTGPNGPLSGLGQTQCLVDFYAQDAIPNYGAAGYQVALYYRSNAPQTAGVKAGGLGTMPDPLTVTPIAMSRDLWTGLSGAGSYDTSFPYEAALSQIPVNADISAGNFGGDWFLTATANISVGDFDANTGLLNLHSMVQVDPRANYTFSSVDADVEFRSQYKSADINAYRPLAMAQPLSGLATHKVWLPFLAVASADSLLYRKGEVLLVVITRYAKLDASNTIVFTNPDSGNCSCAAVYRTSGLLLLASE